MAGEHLQSANKVTMRRIRQLKTEEGDTRSLPDSRIAKPRRSRGTRRRLCRPASRSVPHPPRSRRRQSALTSLWGVRGLRFEGGRNAMDVRAERISARSYLRGYGQIKRVLPIRPRSRRRQSALTSLSGGLDLGILDGRARVRSVGRTCRVETPFFLPSRSLRWERGLRRRRPPSLASVWAGSALASAAGTGGTDLWPSLFEIMFDLMLDFPQDDKKS